jgi:hypothetical protein
MSTTELLEKINKDRELLARHGISFDINGRRVISVSPGDTVIVSAPSHKLTLTAASDSANCAVVRTDAADPNVRVWEPVPWKDIQYIDLR